MRNESIRKIINVDQPNHLPIWSFKQEDDGVLRLSLFKGSTLLDITGQTIKLGAKRPNNSIIELTDGFEINSNELDIILKNNILAIPGIVECDLEITDVVGKMTTASFYLTVTKKMTGEDNLDASNDISAINKIVAEVLAKGKELDSNIKVVVEEANKKITAIDTALNKKLNEMQEDYNSLQRIIIDENQAANLQNQVNQTNAHLENIENNQMSFIDISTIFKSGSDEDIAPVLNDLVKTGKKIYFPVGEWKIKSKVLISQPNAKNNSFIIEGEGNNTTIYFVGESACIEEVLGGSQGHNYHTREIRNIRFVGDSSNNCWIGKGCNVAFKNVNFEDFGTAFESDIVAKYYFENCVFYRNIFGVITRDMTTTITFDRCLMYGHNNIDGCACLFNGFNEHIKFIDCIIPSNKGCSAIIFSKDFSGQCKFDNTYFEVNGDYDKGIYSIDNKSTTNAYDLSFDNCRMVREYHTNPKAGMFNLQNVTFNNSTISMELDNCENISLNNCFINDNGCSNTKKTISFNGVTRIGNIRGESSTMGCGFRIPAIVKECDTQYKNKILNPFADELIFNTSNGTNPPTFSLDTENKLGSKNTEKVVFHNSVGNVSNNNFYPLNTFAPSQIDSNNLIIYSMFVKANKSANLRFLETGDRQLICQDFEVSTEWRKFVFIGKNQSNNTVNTNAFIYPINSVDNLECNFTGLVCYQNVEEIQTDISEMLKGYFNY